MVANLKRKPHAIPQSATELYEVPLPDQDQIAFTPTKDGLPVFHGATYEDHVEAWKHVNKSVECRLWALGAIAASLVAKYGDGTVKKFAGEVRLSRWRIYEIADTYKKFEKSERSQILSFHHHTVAAKAAKPTEAIKKAEDNEWSTRQLDHYVETGFEPEAKQPKAGIALQSVARRALIEHIETVAMPALLDLKTKCPNPQFTSRYYGQWYQDLKDAKEEIEREDFSEALASAWRKGNHTTADLARATNQTTAYVFSVLHDLEEADPPVFERVERGGETEEARGKNEMVWHLVGEPVGSAYSAPRTQSHYRA
jgi:hypothetical protein